jgi:hypothetical protein
MTGDTEAQEIRTKLHEMDGQLAEMRNAGKRYTSEAEAINLEYWQLIDRLAVIEQWPDFATMESTRKPRLGPRPARKLAEALGIGPGQSEEAKQ